MRGRRIDPREAGGGVGVGVTLAVAIVAVEIAVGRSLTGSAPDALPAGTAPEVTRSIAGDETTASVDGLALGGRTRSHAMIARHAASKAPRSAAMVSRRGCASLTRTRSGTAACA